LEVHTVKRSPIVASVAIIVGLLAAGGALAFWKYRQINSSKGGGGFEPAWAVETVKATTKTFQPTAKMIGTVFAIQSVDVRNELAGTITKVGFESGAIVEAGQVILQQDTSTEEAELQAAQAAVKVADAGAEVIKANITLWENNTRRFSQAVEMNAAPASELDNAKASLASAKAQLEQSIAASTEAKARVSQIQAMIAKKTIKAPFRARAGLRNIHPGQYIAEGTTVVALQSLTDDIYVDVAIPQDQAEQVKVGDVFMANSAVLGGTPTPITVSAMDAVVNPMTRNVRIRGVFKNPSERLRPGMFMDVEVPVGKPQELVVVPTTAVRRASYGDHVFLVGPGKTPDELRAKQTFVTLGPTLGDQVAVVKGVDVGAEVAAAGSFKLNEGAKVMRVQPGQTPGTDVSQPPAQPAQANSSH
jgi:membrane fusion protein (multidrug efflux system)